MPITRREFVARSAAAAAAVGVTRFASAATSDTADIRVATIGVHGQGGAHMRSLHKNLVAICDVDEQILATRAKQFEEEFGKKLDTFVDFRDVLKRKDIDAISIAAPNHQHALITIEAAQAGKDVYCEKPASHNVWEGRQMVRAARKYDRIIQCGTQSRSMPSARRAQE